MFFLCLIGYHTRFIEDYAVISKPLDNLLKNNGFEWSEEAKVAFNNLKATMTYASVLDLSQFDKKFIVETDASRIRTGVVLQQNGHPIAYLNKTLSLKH